MDKEETTSPWVVEMRERLKAGEHPIPEMVAVTGLPACPFCGEVAELVIPREDIPKIVAWRTERGLIQNYLPHWSPDDRETLLTGSHPRCFDAAFAEDEDEEVIDPPKWTI